MREHYEAVERTGRHVAELHGPPCPEALVHVFAWFCELSAARGSNGFSQNAISYAEMDAWARLSGVSPSPRDVQILRALDQSYLKHVADANQRSRDRDQRC